MILNAQAKLGVRGLSKLTKGGILQIASSAKHPLDAGVWVGRIPPLGDATSRSDLASLALAERGRCYSSRLPRGDLLSIKLDKPRNALV